jgi:MYXO-CTERM domain-containing protein
MNGNPTCRCEQGYAASAQMTFDNTGVGRITMACSEIDGEVPELPLLPRIGEPTIDPGAPGTPSNPGTPGAGNTGTLAGNSNSGGGCSVALGSTSQRGWAALALLIGLGLRRRQRRG